MKLTLVRRERINARERESSNTYTMSFSRFCKGTIMTIELARHFLLANEINEIKAMQRTNIHYYKQANHYSLISET